MRRSAVLAQIALGALCTACAVSGGTPHTPARSAAGTHTRPPSASAAARHVVPGGCGGTPILAGSPPSWNPKPAGFSPQPPFLSYAVGRDNAVMGYLWARPLYVPEPRNRSNKILWYVRYPRDGNPLRLSGHLDSNPSRTVSETFPDNASPGEIYPSDVTVPVPGCWSFAVRWGTHADHLSLAFIPLPR
jgi:hypothetical protein